MRNNITKFVSYTLNNMLRLPSMYLIILIFMYKKINPEEPTTSNFKRNTSTRKNFRVPHINTKFGCIQKTTKLKKNKSVQLPSKTKKKSIYVQTKNKYKINVNNIKSFMEQQRIIDMGAIRSSVALTHYYQALMSLFSVIYSSSQIITSNIFQNKKLSTGLSGLKFVGVLFNIYQFVWNQLNAIKLKTIARNVMKMGSTSMIFQQKIEFVCRKITLNYNMEKRIQMAFLNTNLDSFWSLLISRFKLSDQVQILEEMYETAPQKMAYWDFSYFVNNHLTDQNFYSLIKQSKSLKKKEMNEQNSVIHNFSYQFIIIQIFIFHQEEADRERDESQNKKIFKQKNCQLI